MMYPGGQMTGGPPSYAPPPGNMPPSYGPPDRAMPPSMSPYGGAGAVPPGGGYPPSSMAPPFAAPPTYAPPATSTGPPSATGLSGPPSGYGGPPAVAGAPAAPSPRPNVMFFSPSGGAAVPAPVGAGTPAPPTLGAVPPPPSGSMGPPTIGPPPTGPGIAAPLSMPPPPSGFVGGVPPPPTTMGVQPGGMPMPGQPLGMPGQPGVVPPPVYSVNYGGAAPMAPAMPHGFDSGTNLAANDPSQPGGAVNNAGAPLPTLEEMDLSIQCNSSFLRATVGKLVSSQNAATASRLPLGIVCKPMSGDKGTTNDEIEVVDFGATGIVRCKRCRTYINPFVSWTDNGRRWRCNICGMLNDVPSTYFSHLDAQGRRRDRDQRPELKNCSVEFVAPGDYMVRPPQPAVYFFVIDVSEPSISSGMIQSAVNAIKASLDEIPGSPRTQVGFITFDQHIHFYNMKSSLSAPQMLVVSDITDIIMPLPEDLLVNLQESRAVVDALLDSLPTMFKTSATPSACTGPALLAAKRVIQHVGGKLILFQSSLPTLGEGALKMRENPRLLGTEKEHTLLQPDETWYKTQAIDFSRLQIAIDTYIFSSQYTDVATLSTLSKYTAGSCYYYPAFYAPRDGEKFEKELSHNLTRSIAFEAVMRVRATRGVRFPNFYGNYFIRGTDLMALPNCTSDSTFTMDIAYDEQQLSAQVITVQAALLYTNSNSERRIRVHTMILPVTHVSDTLWLYKLLCT